MEYPPDVGYCVYQKEIAPDTGTPHFQGYVEFDKQLTIAQVHALGGQWERVHLEARRGSQEQAIDYCSKEESRVAGTSPIVFGVPARSGVKRSAADDIKELTALVREGRTWEWLCMYKPILAKCYKSVIVGMISQNAVERERNCFPWVVYIYGASGLGKTSAIRAIEKEKLWEPKFDDGGGWLEGYNGHEAILFDDFRGHIKFTEFFKYLDCNYSAFSQRNKAPVKNVAKRIYITAPFHIEQQYMGVREDKTQLYRRVHYVWDASKVNVIALVKKLVVTPNLPMRDLDVDVPDVDLPMPSAWREELPPPPALVRQNAIASYDGFNASMY